MSDKKALKEQISAIKAKTKVHQITVSRIVKGRGGDVFVSLNTSYPVEEGNDLTLKEARLAAHLIGLEANLLAHEQACAGDVISFKEYEKRVAEVKESFAYLIANQGKK